MSTAPSTILLHITIKCRCSAYTFSHCSRTGEMRSKMRQRHLRSSVSATVSASHFPSNAYVCTFIHHYIHVPRACVPPFSQKTKSSLQSFFLHPLSWLAASGEEHFHLPISFTCLIYVLLETFSVIRSAFSWNYTFSFAVWSVC